MSTEQTTLKTLPQYDPGLKDQDGLTNRQRSFADHYIALNSTPQPGTPRRGYGTQAVRLAGYQGSDEVLGVQAFRLLRLNNVREYIRRTLKLHIMSSDEVLARLSKQGRASIADVLTNDGAFSLKHAKKRGTDDLIRKLKVKRTRRTERGTGDTIEEITHELELHNAQTALELLGKFHKLWGDAPEQSAPIEINVESGTVLVLLAGALGVQPIIDITPERPELARQSVGQLEENASQGQPEGENQPK